MLQQVETMVSSVTMKVARPLLNKLLGCFGTSDNQKGVEVPTGRITNRLQIDTSTVWEQLQAKMFIYCEIDKGWPFVAQIMEKNHDSIALGWLDIRTQRLETRSAVQQDQIH